LLYACKFIAAGKSRRA